MFTGGMGSRWRRAGAALAAVALAGGLAVALAPGAGATTAEGGDRWVSTTGRDGPDADPHSNTCLDQENPCLTIQRAVDATLSNDVANGYVIHIAAGAYTESVNLPGDSGSSAFHLVGAGGGATTVSGGFTITGGDSQPVTATIENLTVTNSTGDGIVVYPFASVALNGITASDSSGNGIVVYQDATATLTGVAASGNGGSGILIDRALAFRAPGGALAAPQAIGPMPKAYSGTSCGSSVTMTSSSVVGNADDGVTNSTGSLSVTDSTIADNGGAGINSGDSSCTTTVLRSTVSGNGGTGIYAGGFALDITTSTIANNTGSGVAVDVRSSAEIFASTLAGTKAGGPGKSTGDAVTNAELAVLTGNVTPNVGATIIAAQQPDVAACRFPAADGGLDDAGYNLATDSTCGLISAPEGTSIVNPNPGLGSLAGHDSANGTQTIALLVGSPAIDAIGPYVEPGSSADPTSEPGDGFRSPGRALQAAPALGAAPQAVPSPTGFCAPGATDQRGKARPHTAGGRCDIGAYEYHGTVGNGGSQGGGSTSIPTPTPTPSSSPTAPATPTSIASVSASSRSSTQVEVLGASSDAATTSTVIPGLAATGVDADRYAAIGALLLVVGAALLIGLAWRDRRAQH